ncbi:MAG: VWA domain-containing protein, partial [Thermoguttaceae bacterium]|nr:VWA domain-containing protein [Thermoguttaceae bacterium]
MKKSLFRILPAAAIALTFVGGAAQGAESEVSMETYRLSDGANCFLVPLRADAVESTSEFVDVAALVDFSASQLDSDVRAKAQAAVAAMIANLPANARVQLFVVSNEVEALTDGYVAVDSKELGAAVASLKTRAPLGATDLEKAFTVAADSFDYNENADRSIVFVGRGVSAGAAFNEEVFGETVEKLVDARVPVNAFGVGTTVNEDVLGALANRTGGYVVEKEATAKEAGSRLAKAATATVYWPEENALTIAGAEVYPSPLPPIRSDRETYVVGKTTEALDENVEISIPATIADGREAEIAWSVAPSASESSNQYLYRLVEDAAANSGATLSIAGSQFLAARQVALNAATDEALELVDQALADGAVEDAKRLADFVEVSLPADVEETKADSAELFARAEQVIKNQNQANLIDASEANVRVMTQQMKTQAQVAMSEARKLARNNPDAALQSVKMQIACVKRAEVLSAADRALILHDLSACAEQIAFEKEQKAVRDYAAMQNQAVVDAAIKAQQTRQKNQLKVEEIMKRFDSLIKESKFVLAAEAADEAAALAGENSALPTQAANVARLTNAWEENQKLRMKRRVNLLDSLMSVERAHIPVSDEPPVTYPEPEVWITLSKVRKEKYSATNLQGSEAEQRIGQALNVKVDVEGGEDSDLTLSAWIEDVKRQLREEGKDINVVFDNVNIEESEAGGPPSSIMIQENLTGVSLRNALKIVLRPYDLDFCILNDALFITTQDEIKTNPEISTSLRLYSVADLIMQPNQGGSMMGGMGGGMMGGMGGMMGGMGGMMGGMGGGMMGGMGGGMM